MADNEHRSPPVVIQPVIQGQTGAQVFYIPAFQEGYTPQYPSYQQHAPQYPAFAPDVPPGIPPPEYSPSFVYLAPKNESPVSQDASYVCDPGLETINFSTKSIRHNFLRKVYAILTCQLLVTGGAVLLFLLNNEIRFFVWSHPAMLISALVVMVVTLISISCFERVRREYPTNYVFLVILTLSFSYFVATVSSYYGIGSVILALGMTCAICFTLSAFTIQTRWDFTMMTGSLLAFLTVMLMFAIYFALFRISLPLVGYSTLGAMLFSVVLVYDTQMILGGKHRYAISSEEYIFAAVTLYFDSVTIFLFILSANRLCGR